MFCQKKIDVSSSDPAKKLLMQQKQACQKLVYYTNQAMLKFHN